MKQTRKILLPALMLPAMLLASLSLTAQVVPTNDSFPPPTTVPQNIYLDTIVYSPSFKVNYVRSRDFTEPIPYNNSTWAGSDTLPLKNAKETTRYYDEMGRLLQTVQKKLSPTGIDMASQDLYDGFGRKIYEFLPSYGDSSKRDFVLDFIYRQHINLLGVYDPSWISNPSLHPNRENFFYNVNTYENSPLNRPLTRTQAGNGWAGMGKHTSYDYQHNTTADSVRIWTIGTASGSYPQTTAIYAGGDVYDQHGTLYKYTTTDEDSVQTVEFKDQDGHLILKKQQIAASTGAYNGWLCTYYVYDDFGRLRYVIPPKAVDLIRAGSWSLSNATIRDELCFRYEYDGRGRTIVRKVPGAREEYMVYDRRDRLVFSQDGRSRTAHQWLVTFYDGQDRPVETGLYNSTAARSTLQAMMDTVSVTSATVTYAIPAPADLTVSSRSSNTPDTYTARNSITFLPGFSSGSGDSFTASVDPNATEGGTLLAAGEPNPVPPISMGSVTPLTYTYYDDYSWSGHLAFNQADLNKTTDGGNPYAESTHPFEDNNNTGSSRTLGLVTGTRVRVLNSSPEQWLTTTTYYDERGRVVQVLSENLSGGVDVTSTKYDFSGKVLSTYTVAQNNHSSVTPEVRVLTENKYDDAGRLLTVKKKLNDAGTPKQIVQNSYDALGRLATKTLGNNLETLNYEYNVHGWLRGINRDYANGSGSHYFGMELDYDYGFSQPQYNGNIAGERWRTSGDGARRAYGFSYDLASRLTKADFRQYTSGSWNLNANVDYSVSNLAYDANGNIKSMMQKGLITTTSGTVDNMTYHYRNSELSNQLDYVAESGGTTAALGDFKDGHTGAGDYAYDSSGNLTKDLNKAIASISYNPLNLPETITVTGKGTIRFVYDAAGNKLRKTVTDNTASPAKTTTTDYFNGFIYENDTLQLFPTEEGRVRYVPAHGTTAASYVYDYFVKDHLGDTRVVLTEQTDFTQYLATMEQQNAQTEDALFANVESTREAKPMDYPQDETTSPNTAVAKLNGSDPDKRVGPSIILKVMAGDTIEAAVRAFYRQQATTQNNAGVPAEDMAASLMQALSLPQAAAASTHAANPQARLAEPRGGLTSNDLNDLKEKDPNTQREDKPKAYLNYVFFDNQFNFVEDGSGVKQVDSDPNQLETLASGKVVAEKNGYVYVYTSNESQQDVLFDNMGVTQITGPVLEETHYYPYGLTMAGISTAAPLKLENRFKFNGKELNHKEFSDGAGLEWYNYGKRDFDPQIGRFFSVDPFSTKYTYLTPYQYASDNPIKNIDLDGLEGGDANFLYWANQNPFGVIEEGFREYFDAALSMFKFKAEASHNISTNLTEISIGPFTNTTSIKTSQSVSFTVDFSHTLDWTGNNSFHPNVPVMFNFKNSAKYINESSLKMSLDGEPMKLSHSIEKSADGESSESDEISTGFDSDNAKAKVFLKHSKTQKDDKETEKTSLGAKLTVPVKKVGNTTETFESSIELYHEQ